MCIRRLSIGSRIDKEPPYEETSGVHFDTRQQYTIVWEKGKFEEAAEKLKIAIHYSLPDAKMEDE